jgi:branched-chain amino acid aminotransferase
VRNNTLYTAPVATSILPGITRDSIVTLARDMGLSVVEGLIPREALYIADEVFFTGTAAEVTPIRTIDHHVIGQGRRGEITTRIQDAFFDIVHRGNDPYGWLTMVPVGETVVG